MRNGRVFDEQTNYQIRVKGNLEPKWSDWFDRFVIVAQPHDETLLTGQVADQAALHGLLAKLRDLGLPILSLECLEAKNMNDGTLNNQTHVV